MRGKYVLYIDDEEINLFLFEANFSKVCELKNFISATEALSFISSNIKDISLVLSDMQMPIMNGVDFAEEVKKLDQTIPFYIVTAFIQNEDVENAIKKGIVDGAIMKPYEADNIKKLINSYS